MAASNANASASANAAGREMVFTRVFDAPRELVFEAWTTPRHLEQWWGPVGFRTTIHEMDVRPGGEWRLTMRGPDGRDYRNRIVFVEVAKPERLVYQHEPEPGSEPISFQVAVTFAAEGSATRVNMRMTFPSAKARDYVALTYGAIEGANQTLARLAARLRHMQGWEVQIARRFDAPRDLVFQAWTDPEQLRRWWGPAEFTNPVCEIDPRPGGAIRIHMRAPDGVTYPMAGVYREVTPPSRLVFTSGALDENGSLLFEVWNVVTLEEDNGGTNLTLKATVMDITPNALRYLPGAERGWSSSLERLAREVAR